MAAFLRRTLGFVLLAFALAAGVHADNAGIASDLQQAAATANVPGAAVVLLRPDQPPLFVAMGAADAKGRVIDEDTVFRVGSVSKVITAATVAQLVQQGRLDLDEDLRPRADWINAAAGSQPLTLRQLLTHSSGLDDYAVGMFARDASELRPLGDYLATRLPARSTAPDRWTRYSNHGAALAGWVGSAAHGRDFAETVRERLLAPLGMDDSGFEQPIPAARLQRMARAFPCADRQCDPRPIDYRHTAPAGGFVTTPADMQRFMQAVLEPDTPDFAATAELLTRRSWGHRDELPGLALALQEQSIGGWRGLVHAGVSSGYTALIALVPETGTALFVVSTGGSSSFGRSVLQLFESLQPSNAKPSPTVVPVPAEERAVYAGSYLLGRASRSSVESFPGLFLFGQRFDVDDDGWLLRREGGEVVRYGRIEGDLFGMRDGDGRLAFERDRDGRIVAAHAADEFFGARYPASWIRLHDWESPAMVNELMSFAVGLPLLALLLWALLTAVGAIRRRLRRRRATRAIPWLAMLVATGSTVVMLLLAFGFFARFNAMAMRDPQALAYGLPESLAIWQHLAWPSVLLALLSVLFALRSWMQGQRWLDRIVLSLVAICGVGFAFFLQHFHALPGLT
ncbi:MAG: serine hydrolase domain-containing protein [Lysobacteraceae bacterium]